MVVVRESPRSQLSPDKNSAQWPPRSPFQALLSSPSGRKRWEDRQSRTGATSPSPTSAKSRKLQQMVEMTDDDADEEDEEDEETLQLKLEQIKAKLRLKKLRSLKDTSRSSRPADDTRVSKERSGSPAKPSKRPVSPTELYKAAVEVPLSPVRNPRLPQEQLSPARRKLGLTSVPRAQDVSLKRARGGSRLNRQPSRTSVRSLEDVPKPKSFSERLAESRNEAEEREAKKDRLNSIRSTGFGHSKSGASTTSAKHSSHGNGSRSPTRFDNDFKQSTSARSAARAGRANGLDFKHREVPDKVKINPGSSGQSSGTGHAEVMEETSLEIEDTGGDNGYDPFSKIHLTKRHISHSIIAREMDGKEIYSLPRLLKEVKSPDYEPPDCESDYVVFAILASKSNPLDHSQKHRTAEQTKEDYEAPRNKFMVLHLCDLHWELDVFLFGTAFNQFWKLTPGTLLAILNPAILPPKGNHHNGRFSLKLGSSEDAVMEIGVARDLGYCSAIKKDGEPCGEWIDKRKAEACEFHLNLQVERSRKGRMEVNTMFRGAGDAKDNPKSRAQKDSRNGKSLPFKTDAVHGQLYTVKSGMGKSVATLLDAEDTDALHNMTQEEASRKRIANAQRDRDLAKKLGEMGKGPGAEYLRTKQTHNSSTRTGTMSTADAAETARNALFAKPSAADLGLLGKKASNVHLSPAKDRKRHFGLGPLAMSNSTSKSNSVPMGWGGARKAGLLQPKESRLGSPERGQTRLNENRPSLVRPRSQDSSLRSNGSLSPAKKKARFVLERGIREPGRDSLPGKDDSAMDAAPTAAANNNEYYDKNDDDDDLDIIL